MKHREEKNRVGGYDPVHFRSLMAVEDRHFWFRARNEVIAGVVSRSVAGLAPGHRVLEVGCGDGNVLRLLEKACRQGFLVGMDLYGEGLQCARSRTSCSLVRGDVTHSPFGRPFDVIALFDVLEHLPDDRRILLHLREMLGPRGTLLITVPAHRRLWSYFDEASGHCRRYEFNELHTKLEEAGFIVEYLTPFMMSLYPLVWLNRKTKSKTVTATRSNEELVHDELRVVPVVNEIMTWLLSWEAKWVARRKRLPLGSSLLAIARKN